MASLAAEKQQLIRRVDAMAGPWRELALKIHAEPELGLQEKKASAWLADRLTEEGFRVDRGVGGLPTAFAASAGANRSNSFIL